MQKISSFLRSPFQRSSSRVEESPSYFDNNSHKARQNSRLETLFFWLRFLGPLLAILLLLTAYTFFILHRITKEIQNTSSITQNFVEISNVSYSLFPRPHINFDFRFKNNISNIIKNDVSNNFFKAQQAIFNITPLPLYSNGHLGYASGILLIKLPQSAYLLNSENQLAKTDSNRETAAVNFLFSKSGATFYLNLLPLGYRLVNQDNKEGNREILFSKGLALSGNIDQEGFSSNVELPKIELKDKSSQLGLEGIILKAIWQARTRSLSEWTFSLNKGFFESIDNVIPRLDFNNFSAAAKETPADALGFLSFRIQTQLKNLNMGNKNFYSNFQSDLEGQHIFEQAWRSLNYQGTDSAMPVFANSFIQLIEKNPLIKIHQISFVDQRHEKTFIRADIKGQPYPGMESTQLIYQKAFSGDIFIENSQRAVLENLALKIYAQNPGKQDMALLRKKIAETYKQLLLSGILKELTGGRIETHFKLRDGAFTLN